MRLNTDLRREADNCVFEQPVSHPGASKCLARGVRMDWAVPHCLNSTQTCQHQRTVLRWKPRRDTQPVKPRTSARRRSAERFQTRLLHERGVKEMATSVTHKGLPSVT